MNDQDRERIIKNNHQLVKYWQPNRVFTFFADLSSIPRGSGDVAKVADFLEKFADQRGLAHQRDETGNVIISKPGKGGSNSAGVILQAHQDMVCVKTAETVHDFKTDPIELVADEKLLRANGTTLGADDGIGVALALAVLDDPDLVHPPLEALFTVDEETDMKGAKAVQAKSLKGSTLINLDAEDLYIAYVSSAAGASSWLDMPLEYQKGASSRPVYQSVEITGLKGGHSGIEINQARGNAYVLLARFLRAAAEDGDYDLHSFEQGQGHGADNAIPDRAKAVIGLPSAEAAKKLAKLAAEWGGFLANEYRASDPGVKLLIEAAEAPRADRPALTPAGRDRLLNLVRLLPLGVFRFIQTGQLMETAYKDLLVETSCNLGIAQLADGRARLTLLARGSTDSVLDDLMARLADLAALTGSAFTVTNRTSGWEMPSAPTPVQQLFMAQGLKCLGVHAGLECGCLVETFKKDKRSLDAVSVGPDLKDVHSPKERLDIASVKVLWDQLLAVLADLK